MVLKVSGVSKWVLSRRRLIYGVGINDADYVTSPMIEGKQRVCPYYRKWLAMLQRGYCLKFKGKMPTYAGCSVDSSWLLFSNFKKWMQSQDWRGKDLDKDLLVPGNKVYGPETCVFLDRSINNLLKPNAKGVSFDRFCGKFAANCYVNGQPRYLGVYDTEQQARKVYVKFKAEVLMSASLKQNDPRIRKGLTNFAKLLLKEV